MSTDVLFSALGVGGLGTIIGALIAWARFKDKDQADVLERLKSSVSTSLEISEQQARSLATQLTDLRDTAAATRRELEDCQRQCRLLKGLLSDTLTDLEHRGAPTEDYRRRMRAI